MRNLRALILATLVSIGLISWALPSANAATVTTTLAATTVTDTGFTGHCSVSTDRQTRVYLVYGPRGGTLADPTTSDLKLHVQAPGTSDVSITISGLTAGTAYDYMCKAYNTASGTASGAQVTLTTTGASSVTHAIRSLPATDVTETSFIAHCAADASARGKVFVRWGLTASTLPNKSAVTTVYPPGNQDVATQISGLTSNTAYAYQCRFSNASAGTLIAPTTTQVTTASTTTPTPTETPTETTPPPPPVSGPALVAVGDMCTTTTSQTTGCNPTGRLAASLGANYYALLGDTQYNRGLVTEYEAYYTTSSWDPLKAESYPAIGNHEIGSGNDIGYCGYFIRANCPQRYYAYDIGADWRAIVLDSNKPTDAAQLAWLDSELAAVGSKSVVAYWHHARWSNGKHGSDTRTSPFITRLYAAHAEIVLAGHDHQYDRFTKMGPSGPDPMGMRAFVVGTGGRGLYPQTLPWQPGTETVIDNKFGVLKLTLGATSYSWELHTTDGLVADSGTDVITP